MPTGFHKGPLLWAPGFHRDLKYGPLFGKLLVSSAKQQAAVPQSKTSKSTKSRPNCGLLVFYSIAWGYLAFQVPLNPSKGRGWVQGGAADLTRRCIGTFGSFQELGALILVYTIGFKVFGRWCIIHGIWESPTIRGLNIDPQ